MLRAATPGGLLPVAVVAHTAAGADSAPLRLACDARSLAVERVARGSLAADLAWLVVRNEPGILERGVSGLARSPGGRGTLFGIDFRIKAEARGGGTRIDLQSVTLEGRALLPEAAPQAGADATDAVVTVGAPARSLPASASVDWSGRMAISGAANAEPDEGRNRRRQDDWMSAPWAQDLAQRLGGAAGANPESSRPGPGMKSGSRPDLLRALSRAFRRWPAGGSPVPGTRAAAPRLDAPPMPPGNDMGTRRCPYVRGGEAAQPRRRRSARARPARPRPRVA